MSGKYIDEEGYNEEGWSRMGYNKSTGTLYDLNGFDRDGYNKSGYDERGIYNARRDERVKRWEEEKLLNEVFSTLLEKRG